MTQSRGICKTLRGKLVTWVEIRIEAKSSALGRSREMKNVVWSEQKIRTPVSKVRRHLNSSPNSCEGSSRTPEGTGHLYRLTWRPMAWPQWQLREWASLLAETGQVEMGGSESLGLSLAGEFRGDTQRRGGVLSTLSLSLLVRVAPEALTLHIQHPPRCCDQNKALR